ncbi:hypothetical protein VOLCADRAFT_108331 [Volvox carteri f. nagariensis]|uniref:Serine-threonine/tyrosine-protein kinase catalytic domain-containing protein n=1 Tax=Volvox carteri f. nagariensis TaxID=3068 RepID=D8UJI2_VOLCA|nr:uncharacterized protein VOLCADRAFT_108331 [Volvox carteri f. nagariensis]EFJ40127.1 hypothetical protein VOLCADRAFT_108331 [Volvox carteri f. nagariensis]|eukprot:XP_002958823.1 hypothetical protein VOLCADRAFT_108331 [Volvox carteri f. nagariensis]
MDEAWTKSPFGSALHVRHIAYQIALMKVRLPLHHLSDERCPRKLKALIWDCWDPDPARRPAAAEVVKALALVQEVGGYTGDWVVTSYKSQVLHKCGEAARETTAGTQQRLFGAPTRRDLCPLVS